MGPGVAAGVARRFAREGFGLALIARRMQALNEHLPRFAQFGVPVRAYSADAGVADNLRIAFASIEKDMGPVDVLVYNASVLHQGMPSQVEVSTLIDDFKVNVAGALVAVQAVVPHMRAQGAGTILITGGGLAFEPHAPYASLAVGKAGIRSLALSLAEELEPASIHVATVTICGFVGGGEPFMPDTIAETYWRLHMQPRDQWEREVVYR
jgi:short-subunit dehydrogenase